MTADPRNKPRVRVPARRGLRWRVLGEGIHRRTIIELPPHEGRFPSEETKQRIDAIVTTVHGAIPMYRRPLPSIGVSDEMRLRRVPRWEGMR